MTQERRDVNVLLTTCAGEAHTLLSAVLPLRVWKVESIQFVIGTHQIGYQCLAEVMKMVQVILQYCPLDAPINLSLMVGYWKPDVAIFVV